MRKCLFTTLTQIPTQTPTQTTTTGTGIAQIDFGISQLIGLSLAVVSGYGILLLIKNGVEFFSALSDRDAGTMKQAGLGMLSGFGIAAIGAVLSFLGFTW